MSLPYGCETGGEGPAATQSTAAAANASVGADLVSARTSDGGQTGTQPGSTGQQTGEMTSTEQQTDSQPETTQDILARVESILGTENLSSSERSALQMYNNQLSQLHSLKQQRAALQQQLQTGTRLDVSAAREIQSQISTLDAEIAKAETALYAAKNSKQLSGAERRAQAHLAKNLKYTDDFTKIPFDNSAESGTMSAEASALPNRFRRFLPAPKRRLEIIEEGKNLERPIFTKDRLGILARGILPDPNCYDVVLHGSAYGLEYFGEKIDVETLCAIIAQRTDYKKGMNIRLISCHTGAKADGVAQYIADKLNVAVYAPDKMGVVEKLRTGETIVYSGSKRYVHDGEFVLFEPNNKEK